MTPRQLLFSNIEIAKIHEYRLKIALESLKDFLPINAEKFALLSNADYACLDAVAMRYSKLQDMIGSKIFALLLEVMAEKIESNRFLDMLNHLEKIGIIESINFWIDLRNVRNFISHEYPEEPLLLIKNINLLYSCSLKLLKFWEGLLKEFDNLPE